MAALVFRAAPVFGTTLIAWLALLSSASPASAQNTARSGLYVSVSSPLSSDAVTRIKNRVKSAVDRGEQRPTMVVFDFTPGGKDASTADFGPCYDLADYISNLHEVNTVAFIHAKLTGQLVLPALSCRDLVMSSTGSIGEALPTGAGRVTRTQEGAYVELLDRIRPAQTAIALKMLDPDVQLRKGRKGGADWYFDLRNRAAAEKAGVVVINNSPLPATPDDKTATLTSAQARELGLARSLVEDRNELAAAYQVAARSLQDDPLEGRAPTAFRFVLRGGIDGGVRETVRRVAEKVVRERGNLLFLQIDDCGGGDLQAARDLADDLRKLQTESGLMTVAFIPNNAPDTAAVVALGCSEIVMSLRKDAAPSAGDEMPLPSTIGDFEAYLSRRNGGPEQDVELWVTSLRDLADSQGYPGLLVEAMLRRDMELVRAHEKTDRTKKRLMTAAEFEAEKGKWVSDGVVKAKGQFLSLSAPQAVDLGLARYVIETRNIEQVYERYGVEADKVRDATPAWLDRFAAFLKLPPVTLLLVVIAFTGLILEVKVPGTTVPGIVSALCFILVFWAHTQFSGQVAVLAGLLFVLGLVLILIEVFVTPGFGAAGIFGILLMLGSLALVTMEGIPRSGAEWGAFASKMAMYMIAIMVAVVASFLIGRWCLPNVPYMNRMMLLPPDEQPGAVNDGMLPGAAQAASLLGAIGTSATVLRPAGSVRFGDQYVDVVSEGGYVPAGARVQVVEVEGTRIVVKEV